MPLYTARGHIDLFYFEFVHKKAQCYYRPFSFDQCYLFFLLSNNPRRRVGFDILIVKDSGRTIEFLSAFRLQNVPRRSSSCSSTYFNHLCHILAQKVTEMQ